MVDDTVDLVFFYGGVCGGFAEKEGHVGVHYERASMRQLGAHERERLCLVLLTLVLFVAGAVRVLLFFL